MSLPTPLIGILGGMGPQAGLDMAEKLIAMTRAECDQDHLPFILFSLPECISDRTDFLLGKTDTNPAQAIAEQFEKMADMGVTIAVMACNTAYAGPIFDTALEILETFENAWLEVVEEEASKNEDFAKVWASLSEFRKCYKTWKDLGFVE